MLLAQICNRDQNVILVDERSIHQAFDSIRSKTQAFGHYRKNSLAGILIELGSTTRPHHTDLVTSCLLVGYIAKRHGGVKQTK